MGTTKTIFKAIGLIFGTLIFCALAWVFFVIGFSILACGGGGC